MKNRSKSRRSSETIPVLQSRPWSEEQFKQARKLYGKPFRSREAAVAAHNHGVDLANTFWDRKTSEYKSLIGLSWNSGRLCEAIAFEGNGIIWTNGNEKKEISLQEAASWYANMQRLLIAGPEFINHVRDEADTKARVKFLIIMARALAGKGGAK